MEKKKKADDDPDETSRRSVLSADSWKSRLSQGSRHSGKNSAASFRGIASFFERSTFTVSEWLLLLIEMCLSFSWAVIRDRRRTGYDLITRGWTERMELMDVYLRRGLSGIVAMLAGYIADTYYGIYPVALFNIVLHFVVSTILVMEETVKYNDYDIYHVIVWETIGWTFIPLKATDFARMVFGLEKLGRKNMKAVFLFIFISVWLNERSCGGVLLLVIGIFELSQRNSARLSFLLAGFSAALYIYYFRPDPNKITSISGIGNKIAGCVVTALWTKWRVRGKIKGKVWIELALVKYDKLYVHKTKQLLRLYIMITPAVGLLFFVTSRSDFYYQLWYKMRPDGFFYYTGVIGGARIIAIFTMPFVGLILIPLYLKIKGVRRSFVRRQVIGYLSAIFCYLYAALVLRDTEGLQPSLSLGIIRIINVGQIPVRVISREPDFLHFDYHIEQQSGIVVAIDIKVKTLFRMMFQFGNETNFTSFVSVTPNEVQGYVASYPPDIIKISGYLPIWYTPPGYNVPYLPRLYITNMIRWTNATITFTALQKDGTRSETMYRTFVSEGESSSFQLPAGTYKVEIAETALSGDPKIVVGPGGVYTLVLFSTRSSNQIYEDTMVNENKLSAYSTFGISIPYAVTLVFSYVSLRAFLYTNTPEGLEGLCFGFLEAVENSTAWILWIGYQTWHPINVNSLTITIYCVLLAFLLFFCLFISIKYDDYYRW